MKVVPGSSSFENELIGRGGEMGTSDMEENE
jgi:hypothetical protein